jgi:hypothetical protein
MTAGRVYCFACKFFATLSSFIVLGFSDGEKAEQKTNNHENRAQHQQSMAQWIITANKKQGVTWHIA